MLLVWWAMINSACGNVMYQRRKYSGGVLWVGNGLEFSGNHRRRMIGDTGIIIIGFGSLLSLARLR